MGVSWARGRGISFAIHRIWKIFRNLWVVTLGNSHGGFCVSHSTGGGNDAREVETMKELVLRLGREEKGQDIAEYAVMLAVILVIVVGTIRLIGTNANNVFSSVASAVQ